MKIIKSKSLLETAGLVHLSKSCTVYVTRVITGFNDVKHDLYTGSHWRRNVQTTRTINSLTIRGQKSNRNKCEKCQWSGCFSSLSFPDLLYCIYYCRKQILWHNNLPISSKWRQCGTIYFNGHYMDSTGHADTKAGHRRLHVICRLRGLPFGLKNGATNSAFVWVEACHKEYPQT